MELIQLKGQRLKALLELHFSKYNNKNSTGTKCDFERELGYRNAHPGLRDLFDYLICIKAMVKAKVVMGINFYYINRKELKKLIDVQKLLNAHIKYLDNVAILYR